MSFPLLHLLKNPTFISRKNMIQIDKNMIQIAIKNKKKKKKKQLIVYKIMSETS